MKYKCIIFDCDGILVDSEEISNSILAQMVRDLGFELDASYALKYFTGRSLKSNFDHIESIIEQRLPPTFEQEYRTKTFAAFKSDLKPIKGIREVLDQITLPFCVASSGPKNKIVLNLTTTKLIDYFEGNIFSAYEINKWKPDPDIFEYAARKMGFRPYECAVVEDSMAGIQAGISGGFDVFAFSKPKDNDAFEEVGAITFSDMSSLLPLMHQS